MIKQILWNMISGWFAVLARTGIAFFLVPFLISHLGRDGYGLVGVVGVIVGLSQLADLGLREALGRELTEQVARGDQKRFSEFLSTTLFLYLGIASVLSLLVWGFAPWFVHLFKVPQEMDSIAVVVVRSYGIVALFCSFMSPVFSAALSSSGRFDLINNATTGVSLFSGCCMFIVLSVVDNPFYGWVGVMMLNQVGVLAAFYCFFRRVCPGVSIRIKYAQWRNLSSLLRLGGGLYILQLTRSLGAHSDPLVISYFFGPAGVALYQPGARLSTIVRPMVSTLANQLYPLTTKQHIDQNQGKMWQILVLGTKYTLLMGGLACVGLIACSDILCQLWLGDTIGAKDCQTVSFVVIGWAFVDFTIYAGGSQWAVLLGARRIAVLVYIQLTTAFLNLFISIYLVGFTKAGIPGALVATIIIGILRRPILIHYTARICEKTGWDYFLRAYAKPILITSVLGAVAAAVRWFWSPESWGGLLLFACGLGVLWALLMWGGAFDSEEKRHVAALVDVFFVRFRKKFSC